MSDDLHAQVELIFLETTQATSAHLTRLHNELSKSIPSRYFSLPEIETHLRQNSFSRNPWLPPWAQVLKKRLLAGFSLSMILAAISLKIPGLVFLSWLHEVFSRLPNRLSSVFFSEHTFGRLRALKLFRDEIAAGADNALVVLPEENLLADGLLIGNFLKANNLRHVVFNYTIGVEDEWTQHFSSMKKKVRLVPKLMRDRLFSKQIATGTIFLPLRSEVEAKFYRNRVAKPWSGQIGIADYYVVDSQREYENLSFLGQRVGLVDPIEKHSILQESKKLLEDERFRHLAILLPPNQWPGEDGAIKYLSLLEEIKLVSDTIKTGWQVFVSLHPRADLSNDSITSLAKAIGEVVELEEALARSKVILQFGSAIYRISEALGQSVVDWDAYGYGAMKALDRPRVPLIHVTSAEMATNALTELLSHTHVSATRPLEEWNGVSLFRSLLREFAHD